MSTSGNDPIKLPVLTAAEAARFVGKSTSWIRRVTARGDIKDVIETPLGRLYNTNSLIEWAEKKRKIGRPKKKRSKKKIQNKT